MKLFFCIKVIKLNKMSIFYSLIAKNYDLILTECTDYTGNFQQITRLLLYKIKINLSKYNNNNNNNNNHNMFRIQYDNYIYNYLIKDNLLFLCMTFNDHINYNNSPINNYSINDNNQNIIYAFLFDVKKFFATEYTQQEIEKIKSYELQDFEKTLNVLMNYYNSKPKFTKSGLPINNLMPEDEQIIVDNINKYFDSDEILNITVVQNETYNSLTITKKNIVLSGYIRRKEKIEQFKTLSKILGFICGFIFILYLMIHFFGNKENSTMKSE